MDDQRMNIKTVNPYTGEIIKEYPVYDGSQITQVIQQGHQCFQEWRLASFDVRRTLMNQLAKCLRSHELDYAKLMACEMGKPITAGRGEILKCAFVCEHYAENAARYLASRTIDIQRGKRMVCYQPIGVIFSIMPWNFPFWQVFRFAAPTIMAGNAAILKHAPISTGTGQAIVALFQEAGFPEHLFQQLVIDEEAAASVIAHPAVAAITLTGSERAGRTVASFAGLHLKKCVLELGGNDPYIVLADADIDFAAQCIVTSRLNNNGQVCIAAKRVIVIENVHDALLARIQHYIEDYSMGDPLDSNTKLGPMAREDLRATLHQQVLSSISKGAVLVQGGNIPELPGYFYPPTILTNVVPGMSAFDEELFGPVVSIVSVKTPQEAIKLANQSQYGLSASIFTHDTEKGEHIAIHDIETGTCYVNGIVSSDPRVPFGGIKSSGFGRELSREGILEFVNIKTIGIGS
jgi:succinate-semialdehyde dehydrogenase/glutarate-semialdehyde dehydrogenase